MTIAFQLVVFALIATSSILLISVLVVFSSPDSLSSNKNVGMHFIWRFSGCLLPYYFCIAFSFYALSCLILHNLLQHLFLG